MPNDYPSGSTESGAPDALDHAILSALRERGIDVSTVALDRAEHGRDWWPLSIPMVESGCVPHWPGAVVRANSIDEISAVLRIASEHRIAVTAQGGRSGVEGGAVAPDGAIALDLTAMDAIGPLDEVSGTVRVEAGVFGPDLERFVNAHGWTVGHFPQSFELATVGGWLACRGAGQFSNRYGKIEDIVRGLTVVLASGDIAELGGRGPRQAVGPDLVQLFVGSEGSLGVIASATLALHRRPDAELRAAYSFASFGKGLEACRRIVQRGAHPAVLRLYDATESRRSFDATGCVLIVLEEGDGALVEAVMAIVTDECRTGENIGPAHVERWLEHRNDVSALAPLWNQGLVVDTIEVGGPWSVLDVMNDHVHEVLGALPEIIVVSTHQSHAYSDGACLYFTFAAKAEGDSTSLYRRIWDMATAAVLEDGGSLSHHHGVGRNRARFVPAALGSGFPVLESLKSTLDPRNILNPGVLGLGGPAW